MITSSTPRSQASQASRKRSAAAASSVTWIATTWLSSRGDRPGVGQRLAGLHPQLGHRHHRPDHDLLRHQRRLGPPGAVQPQVVGLDAAQHHDQQRDQQHHQPGAVDELGAGDHQRDDAGRHRADAVDDRRRRQPGPRSRRQCTTMPACESVKLVKTPTA